MKKRILVLAVGFLFVGINVFAADGDLIVNGNATVGGNATVNGTLTVQGIKLTHVTGTNPTCPSGTVFLMRKWAAKTCSDAGCSSCTTAAGWGVVPNTCQYTTNFCVYIDYGYSCSCGDTTCSSSNWTEAICMGN